MGIFSNPKCPRCGNKTVETHYAFPFPQYRCDNCIREKQKQDKIDELEERLRQIEENSICDSASEGN